MIFFTIQRILFLSLYSSFEEYGMNEILLCNIKAIPMDIASAFYLTGIPLIGIIVSIYLNKTHKINRFIHVYSVVVIIICLLICIGDLGIFKVWGTKINARAISYLVYPEEVLPTLFSIENLNLMLLIGAQLFFFIWLLKKITRPVENDELDRSSKILIPIFLLACFIVGIRGGLQKIPVNRNWVFFSKHSTLNFAGLNGFWNFADILFNPINSQNNQYVYFKPNDAKKLVNEMYTYPLDSTKHILTTERPNVVIIFLESWAADVVECVGGEKDVTPKFGELAKEGILFKRFYATGNRTEQGMLAVLNAIPALPVSSIITEFGKFDKIENLYHVFNNAGYHTSYFTGGRLQFDNIEAYMRSSGVQHIVGEDNFTIINRTNWGAYDDETYNKQLSDLHYVKEPFFSTLSSMITHEFFDANVPKVFTKDKDRVCDSYRNTMHYADSCLYAYIQSAKKTSWYKNTLFIIVADHSCIFPRGRKNYEPDRHHIPMLITGGALKEEYRGVETDVIGSHIDIPATILAQLNLSSQKFPKSKNLFNAKSPKFAYYTFDNGFGIVHAENEIVFDHNQMKTVMEKNPTDKNKEKLLNFGKAFLQLTFQENIDLAEIKRK